MNTPSKKLYDLAMSHKGEYLTLDKAVPKQYNCCECMSYLFKEAGYTLPTFGIPGTVLIDTWLNRTFKLIKEEEATMGDVLLFLTEGQNHGHIFILGKSALLSNDSDSGTLQSYWTLAGALGYYRDQKKLTGKFYRPV